MAKIEIESKGRAFIVTINRPEVRNAVDGETAELLCKAVDTFRKDDGLDVLILTGAGDVSFCAGADLRKVESLISWKYSETCGPMGISRITDVRKPTIAAVNGYCLAGGLELACWCDFRIASRNASFGVVNRRWGVPLIDGGTQRLWRVVGLGNALYMIETGVQIDAEHALRIGLVQEIVSQGQALSRSLELAKSISSYPQVSLRNDRRSVYEGLSLPLPEGLRLEKRLHKDSIKDPGMAEGIRRYSDGRRPQPPRPESR
ncbi:MAG: enoyl-CoA hydratase [Chloroflexi bacterium]|nr:enoyl-CoA hydratase [Chloroflexota bacterium]MBM3165831.1 enoyl-CoA hydratase [Chloroflexota bacterium]MBM3172464.1 enoyl-CoA hydratase [Chloroflexota bacterium]MBM4449307.1 enoyl-CoA hydratase [Chloroflexota bacterium]